MRKKITVLTGAGISAESGLQTFRDSDGLWNGYRIEDVATPEAWMQDPLRVLEFYNMRRRDALHAQPNEAHLGLAAIEQCHDVFIITQNVDDLHERAGSSNILHLHGELTKMRSESNPDMIYDVRKDIQLGDHAEDGAQLRPHIVWFGEDVPKLWDAVQLVRDADVFVIIGTSLQVYPAAGLVDHFSFDGHMYVIDTAIPRINRHMRIDNALTFIEKPATEGVKELRSLLGCP